MALGFCPGDDFTEKGFGNGFVVNAFKKIEICAV